MKKKLFTVLTLVLFLFQFTLVFAQETPQRVFAEMDANQDGKVTKEEFMTFHMEYAKKIREPKFDRLDTNGDGKITRDEYAAVNIKEAQAIGKVKFRRIDANKDGVLSQQEIEKRFRIVKQILQDLSD
jgi:Ca2+-binding EF-hand superfamily protein